MIQIINRSINVVGFFAEWVLASLTQYHSFIHSFEGFKKKKKAVIEIRNRGFNFHHIPCANTYSLYLSLSLSLSSATHLP